MNVTGGPRCQVAAWGFGVVSVFVFRLRSSSSVFGLRRFVSSVRQAHIRFRATVISKPALWLNLYRNSRAEATFAPQYRGHCGAASTSTRAVFNLGAAFVASARNFVRRLIIMDCAVGGGILAATRVRLHCTWRRGKGLDL